MSEIESVIQEQPRLTRWQKIALGGVGCTLAGGFAALPLATAHMLRDTVVHDGAGLVPTDIRLAPKHTVLDAGPGGKVFDDDLTKFNIGIDLELAGPPELISALASGQSSKLDATANQLADYIGDPAAAQAGYESAIMDEAVSMLSRRELEAGITLAALFGIVAAANRKTRTAENAKKTTRRTIAAVTAASFIVSGLNIYDWTQSSDHPPAQTYPLSSLADTDLENAVTDNPTLAGLINHGKAIYDREIQRELTANADFLATAFASIREQVSNGAISLPGPDETMFLTTSDIHENNDMIKVMHFAVQQINAFGIKQAKHYTASQVDGPNGQKVIAIVVDSGDKAYGEVSAKQAITDEANIGGGAPFVTVGGNHDTPITQQQSKAAGMNELLGKSITKAGIKVLGNTDPLITNLAALFDSSESIPRNNGTETETETIQRISDKLADFFSIETQSNLSLNTRFEIETGKKLLELAKVDRPTVLTVHEAYMLAPTIGVINPSKAAMDEWFAAGHDNSGSLSDGVPDQPAALETYGHWHRLNTKKHKLYRVVSNSDGSWTLVLEEGTSGGANGAQRLSKVSLPWTPPAQTASMDLITINNKSQLVTQFQQLNTSTTGEFQPQSPVHIGSPNGQPYKTIDQKTDKKLRNLEKDKQHPTTKKLSESHRDYK